MARPLVSEKIDNHCVRDEPPFPRQPDVRAGVFQMTAVDVTRQSLAAELVDGEAGPVVELVPLHSLRKPQPDHQCLAGALFRAEFFGLADRRFAEMLLSVFVLGPLLAARDGILRLLGDERHQVADRQQHRQERKQPHELRPCQADARRLDGRDSGIVLGAVASQPREATKAGAALAGQRLTPETIEKVSDLAAGPSRPLDNTDFTHPYRKKKTRVFVTRALRRIAGLAARESASEEVG